MRKLFLVVSSLALSLFVFFYMNPAVHAQSFGWGYKKNSDHKVPEIGKYRDMLDKYGAYYADHSGDKVVYLTFDNGYEQGYTDDILDVLKAEDVPATFFVTGHYVKSEPDLVKRMANEGHIIGNHSYHHPDLTILTKDSMKMELEELEKAVAAITDQKQLKYMRPPKGVFNERSLKWANDLGYIHIFWSLAFADWNTKAQKGGQYAFDQIMKQMHPGAIILLHTVSSDNADALSKLIKELKSQGYQFKSLDDLVLKDMLPKAIYGF
ncbi:peptidoglycan-N-acetylmuramic acid deacetylase PdaA [Lentibacillus populi]|uniref:Peptidoglycan-N-acetylmuramic acid deacetylase PdaA n=1 Tax=Lentibacillus populi TaxID=1827502 RepID=A0A9W5X7E6_9BACI|nr:MULTISPECIES: delta-lactam-biosynthetic de-N-acetylase [Bacillaceae]MBT2217711.1 delta-lactam-biosynthetic de-N-acetylase [Virgibacillus dakarensis]GGB59699.1 peptidoglycan-N-acetylmuramic acid deacetylase PdaA [Lentibacillus populi]